MCYDDNARPPLPPGEAGPAHGEDLVLTAADGNRFAAYLGKPASASRAQMNCVMSCEPMRLSTRS